ncbi:MAG: nucleotide exchange factor GrpE [Ruminococcaceae bacterium]|nr:nucleotide exchange factor GrpE [Oscillospiraceae bacterium]
MEEKNETVNEEIKTETAEVKKKKTKEEKRLEAELEKLQGELAAETDKYMRMLAEYDNFRRRTAKEREGIYADAYADAVTELLPIIDNLERAAMFSDAESVGKGVQMTLAAVREVLAKIGVTEIENETFDPNFHNAVMHVEDEAYGEGAIVEVLQKGYKKGDKIIRYSMVKVAN